MVVVDNSKQISTITKPPTTTPNKVHKSSDKRRINPYSVTLPENETKQRCTSTKSATTHGSGHQRSVSSGSTANQGSDHQQSVCSIEPVKPLDSSHQKGTAIQQQRGQTNTTGQVINVKTHHVDQGNNQSEKQRDEELIKILSNNERSYTPPTATIADESDSDSSSSSE